jgi:Patatin-like phospholipase
MSNARGAAHTDCPASLNQMLEAELERLRPGLLGDLPAATICCPQAEQSENLKKIYGRIGKIPSLLKDGEPLAALCLSGGGIRSATFNLGVLQGLAKLGLLDKFDYLSSVSGGGYIAGWLRTWIYHESLINEQHIAGRDGFAEVAKKLAHTDPRDPLSPEPDPVANLRDYSNYLTPQVGLFSGDTWAAAAIIARNLLLNWLVLVPLMAAVIGLPLLFLLVVRTSSPGIWGKCLLGVALAAELGASLLVYCFRRFAKRSPTSQIYFIGLCVFPVVAAASALSTATLALDLSWLKPVPGDADLPDLWWFSATWCIGIPLVGWAVTQLLAVRHPRWTQPRVARQHQESPRRQRSEGNRDQAVSQKDDLLNLPRQVPWAWEIVGILFSGSVGMLLLVGVTVGWLPYLYAHPAPYVIFALPILLGIYLASRALFVGVASLGETFARCERGAKEKRSLLISSDDSDREWWARLSGWILLVVVLWVITTGLCLVDSYIPQAVDAMLGHLGAVPGTSPPSDRWTSIVAIAKWSIGAIGVLSGLIAALTGRSGGTPGRPGAPIRGMGKKVLAVTGPLFVVCLIIMLSWGDTALGELITGRPDLFDFRGDRVRRTAEQAFLISSNPSPDWMKFPLVILGLAGVSVIAGCFVNINLFSMHGMYRNRLVRAYLGASNCRSIAGHPRIPDPFTGFALSDNVALYELCPKDGPAGCARPLPIINTTLNLVHGDNLAWQQRKAESFSMTPLFCGSWHEGYRPSRHYGGNSGITVGTAVTISGAAANPNMGYSSSPMLSFLMAFFNVRLGAWLGNTNRFGQRSYSRPGPRQALLPFLAEMFGLTNSQRSYVNLSDGGHFDNLGLYEAVLRRCRYIMVSDAGQDGSFSFEDLGNAIRKIRIDFGIDIVFKQKIEILPNSSKEKGGLLYARAEIRYSAIDGADCANGTLLYIKPSLRGRDTNGEVLPYDIYSYARSSADFPHESTVDQWFSESQFESYRTLGCHIVEEVGASAQPPIASLAQFFKLGDPT